MKMADEQFFFDDFFTAYEAAQSRRARLAEDGIAVRVEESPYGDGYQVRHIPVGLMLDCGFLGAMPLSPLPKYSNSNGRKKRHF